MESAAESLVTNGWQLLAEEYRQLSGVGGEVAELRDDVATMNAVLRMQSEAADDGAGVDHFVREWMKQLRELAYDAEDCVDLYKLRIKFKTRWRGSVRLWFKHHLETLFSRRRLAGEISALRARAVAISERHARYGVSRDALRRGSPASLSAPPPVLASSSAHVFGFASDPDESHQVVGIDEQT
jgi:disease resistance protein RPM1